MNEKAVTFKVHQSRLMTSIQGSWGWQLLASALIVGGAIATSGNCALGQVVGDTTLGAESSQVTSPTPGGFQIDGGATRGTNLFHSFSEFSVPTNGSAYFNNALTIENILTRVTGASTSNIDGTIRANGTANLFLINPNGIVFGSNASLNVGGSFLASTARSLVFDNGFEFSATNPQAPPLLTLSVPLGLQYGSNAGSIQAQRSRLQVPDGKTLGFAGGNVQLDGAILPAPGGRVELAGVGSSGTVGLSGNGSELRLSIADGVPRGDVSLTNGARVDVRTSGGGNIAVNARNLNMAGGSLLVAGIGHDLGSTDSRAGDIEIKATEAINLTDASLIANQVAPRSVGQGGDINITTSTLSVTNGAQLSTSTVGRGDAGSMNITASDRVFIDGVASNGVASAVASTVEAEAVGKGGEININTGSLSVTNGAGLTTSTRGQGDAGKMQITASESISFDGGLALSRVEAGAVGQGGDINITTGSFSLTNGAVLNTSARGQGDAGNVNITARDRVSLDGVGSDGSPSSVGGVVGPGVVGKGGNINITTGSLSVTNRAGLITSTLGQGDAGNVNITASDRVSFDGGLALSTVEAGAVGKGGEININTGSLSVTNGAALTASTFGQGDAGSMTITATDSVSFDRESTALTTVGEGTVGLGGDINITADSLAITNGALLNASTLGQGDAGNVNITTSDRVSFDGKDSNRAVTGVLSVVGLEAEGKGGDINITTGSLSLTNRAFMATASLGQGNAGDLQITARDLELNNQGFISAQTLSANGGDITLNVQDLLLMRRNSLISTTAGELNQGGDGGNMDINAQFIVAVPKEDSDITANAYTGRGGNINITTQGIYGLQSRPERTPLSDITASSQLGVDGVVEINSPDVDPSRGLGELPSNVVEATELIDRRCSPGDATDQRSSFTITGRGGLPPSPDGPLDADVVVVDWGMLDSLSDRPSRNDTSGNPNRSAPAAATPPQTPTITEASGWRYGANGEVILTAEASNVLPHSPAMMPVTCPSL